MNKKITIIDYGIGNLASVANALTTLNADWMISSKKSDMKKADGLILPGVGAAGTGMKNLKKYDLKDVLIEQIKSGKPIMGICLGMQLLFEKSEEGDIPCLGILKGTVKKFKKEKKIPQIGWNNVRIMNKELIIMENIPDNSYFYFVNSYYCTPSDKSIILGKTEYGESFASVVVRDNILGVQFHPEKSGKVGFKLLDNFIKYYVN